MLVKVTNSMTIHVMTVYIMEYFLSLYTLTVYFRLNEEQRQKIIGFEHSLQNNTK